MTRSARERTRRAHVCYPLTELPIARVAIWIELGKLLAHDDRRRLSAYEVLLTSMKIGTT